MSYALVSENKCLKSLRKKYPLNQEAIDLIIRSDFSPLNELVLGHYEINPFTIEYSSFEKFEETTDSFRIIELFRRSAYLKQVECLSIWGQREPVRRQDYVEWAAKKGFPLPGYLVQQVIAWEPPLLGTVEDVKKIDYGKFSPSVLAAFGANIFAQAAKRADPKTKISTIYQSQLMQKFLANCSVAEGSDKAKAQSTIRKHIQLQFPDEAVD